MWSPDSGQILFHARRDGQSGADLFSIPASGGPLKRLTTDPSNDILASYSQDGRWIYFASNRSGRSEIWKMPSAGGDATRITNGGATMPLESLDGATLFYAHINPEKGLWKIPVQGGIAEQVTGPIAKDFAFAVATRGIYYVSPPESPTRQLIQFWSFSTGESHPVVVANQEIGLGLSLSPDERFLIFAQRDNAGSDLMLVKDFDAPW
jgi:Tol biopolymer transport system component